MASNGIYPSAELALIRRDLKSMEKPVGDEAPLLENLQVEIQFLGRKIALMRARRQEELEARAIAERKAARVREREIQTYHTRDPLSFH
jgi:hypothetical protein